MAGLGVTIATGDALGVGRGVGAGVGVGVAVGTGVGTACDSCGGLEHDANNAMPTTAIALIVFLILPGPDYV